MYRLFFTPIAKQQVKKLPPPVKQQIRHACGELCQSPHSGKLLRDELTGYYSWRHTHYRILYTLDDDQKTVIVEYIGRRKLVYELFGALVKTKRRQ